MTSDLVAWWIGRVDEKMESVVCRAEEGVKDKVTYHH